MHELLQLDAHDLIRKLRSREVTAVEVMTATLDRISQVNGTYNAIVSLRDRDAILDEARSVDEGPDRGALHGLPIAVKDLADVAGIPTSQGSPIFAGDVPDKNELMVRRMLDSGAIVIGKTNTPEFGLGSHTYNPVFGATQNALLPGHSAGGSSGGAAVALATNMVSLADGSDMMGSLRNPAGWNGVYGFRPSWSRVPSEPNGDTFFNQLSTCGPMARSPRDIALLLEVQSGVDPRQPFGLPWEDYQNCLDVDVSGRRIGWLGNWGGAYAMESGLLSQSETAVKKFAELGCLVEDIEAPFDAAEIWKAWVTLRSWTVSESLGPLYDDREKNALLKPEAVWEVERGRRVQASDIRKANLIQSRWFKIAAKLFERYDALVMPTAQCFPFPVAMDWPKQIAGVEMDTYHRWMEVVVPVSLIGLPSMAIPAVIEPKPMGLQLIGRRNGDLDVLQLGQAWHKRFYQKEKR